MVTIMDEAKLDELIEDMVGRGVLKYARKCEATEMLKSALGLGKEEAPAKEPVKEPEPKKPEPPKQKPPTQSVAPDSAKMAPTADPSAAKKAPAKNS